MARRLSESTLHERIRLQRPPDELKELGDTFDAMLERLDRSFAGQRQFVANASHELRTPLTIIRTELDVALADPDLPREELEATATAMRDALARSEEVIDGLLVLARSDALTETEAVDLAELVRQSLERPPRPTPPGSARSWLWSRRWLKATGGCSAAWSTIWSRTPYCTTSRAAGSG